MVRNPFDIIATTYIYKMGGSRQNAKLRANLNATVATEEDVLDCLVERHVQEVTSLNSMASQLPVVIQRIFIEQFVQNPKEEILKLCNFLELECRQEYIDNCAAVIFPSSSNSRYKLQWTQRQINRVFELISATPYLRDKYPTDF